MAHNIDKFQRPEVFFQEILKKGIQGSYRDVEDNVRIFYRAVVVAVDVNGAKLENPKAEGTVEHVSFNGQKFNVKANVGPENPRNSIKARVITDGLDQFYSDKDLKIFWPLLPEHMSMPVKPGEHVYVMFEDTSFNHGLWLGKIPGHEGVNFVQGEKKWVSVDDKNLAKNFPDAPKPASKPTDSEAAESYITTDRLTVLFK